MKNKILYVVFSNTDLTEGRGIDIPIAVCRNKATAKRKAYKKYIQGSDAPIKEVEMIYINNQWYIPSVAVDIIQPTNEDIIEQKRIDYTEEIYNKAKNLGLTDEELITLGYK